MTNKSGLDIEKDIVSGKRRLNDAPTDTTSSYQHTAATYTGASYQHTAAADTRRSDRNIAWIEQHCFIPSGQLVGQPVRLTDHQKRWLSHLYDSPTRTLILSMPRKNAKTALTAFLLLLHLVGPEAVRAGQLYSAAQSRKQAAILFDYAADSVRMSPTLSQYVSIKDSAKELHCKGLGTVYKALSAESKTAYGLSPVFTVHDELGQVRGPHSDLYDALETASAAHANPLSIIISTQAPTDGDLLSLLIDDAQRGNDPARKCVLYTCPKEHEEPFSADALEIANPHWNEFINQTELLSSAESARRMPSGEGAYRNYHLNQRVEASDPFVSRTVWRDNGAVPAPLEGQRVWGGLDLSQVSDLTALTLVSDTGDVYVYAWLPAEGIHDKARADRVDYVNWSKEGLLELVPGRSISYEHVAQRIYQICQTCDVQQIGFDSAYMHQLRPWLEKAGFTQNEIDVQFVEVRQGFITFGPLVRTLEEKLLNSELKHGNNKLLEWCAQNAVTVTDPAGNRKFVKPHKSSGKRIDALVCLTMAVGVRGTNTKPKRKKLSASALKHY